MTMIESKYNCTDAINPEIKQRWYPLGIMKGYTPVMTPANTFVSTVGRVKYIKPVYSALQNSDQHDLGVQWLNQNMDFYHPVAVSSIQTVLGVELAPTQAFLKYNSGK